jgi:hypothetical protein
MQRREFLKRAAVVPVAATLGTLLASTEAEASVLTGQLYNIFPGGEGPESFNGGDIVVKFTDHIKGVGANGLPVEHTALVDKKTKIFIFGGKVKYRLLLEEVYGAQQVLLQNLFGANVLATYRTGLKVKRIDINHPLPPF